MWGSFNTGSSGGNGNEAVDMAYDNSGSGAAADNVQDAVDLAATIPWPVLTVVSCPGANVTVSKGGSSISGVINEKGFFSTSIKEPGLWDCVVSYRDGGTDVSISESIYCARKNYTVDLSVSASSYAVNVSTEPYAAVRVVFESGRVVSTVADQNGQASVPRKLASDKFTIHSSIFGADAQTEYVSLPPSSNYSYTANFRKIKLASPENCNVFVRKFKSESNSCLTYGDEISIVSSGSDTIFVPEDGRWHVCIEKNGVFDSGTVFFGEYEYAEKQLALSFVPIIPENIADASPRAIKYAVELGVAEDLWDVGDTVPIAINGTVGSLAINGTYYAVVLGFNHNADKESDGKNSIHFQIGKDENGVDIAFCDSSYSTAETSAAFRMNLNKTCAGGWSSSYMRQKICPAFLNALPAAWNAAISDCTKYSDNTGGPDTASYVTATTDKIWLLAEWEVFGTKLYANSAEQTWQVQYDYYRNGNSKLKYRHDTADTLCVWWLRSTCATEFIYYFCTINAETYSSINMAYDSLGFAPCFMIAA